MVFLIILLVICVIALVSLYLGNTKKPDPSVVGGLLLLAMFIIGISFVIAIKLIEKTNNTSVEYEQRIEYKKIGNEYVPVDTVYVVK